jgi:hypothetical protein
VDVAEQLGNELLAALLTQGKTRAQGGLTLVDLWTRFSRECVEWRDNAMSTRRDDERRALVLLAHFGDDCDVRSLTPNDVAVFAAQRRAGGIQFVDRRGEETTTRAVRSRAVECDVKLLRAMLRWATTVRVPPGRSTTAGCEIRSTGSNSSVRRIRADPLRRGSGSRKPESAIGELRDAEEQGDDRLRWGAARIWPRDRRSDRQTNRISAVNSSGRILT